MALAGACAPAGDAAGSGATPQADAGELLTRAERTDYRETSSYEDVVVFVDAVVPMSDRLHRTTFGYTLEGRPLPMVVFGNVADASPAAVRDSGRTVVWIQGNIHGGEVCGKEAMLMLLRDLARGEHADWADSLVLLIAPIYNADGNERVEVGNRGSQNGPVGGMGQRPNAQGFDLNRDHMKLESPEARSLVKMMNDYDPHVGVDLHTTNGTRHAYHLTYSPPLHPNTPAPIDDMLRDEWLPAVTTAVKESHGWDFYYYGNAGGGGFGRGGGGEQGWRTFDHRPRFNNNYIGLRNRFAILSEAYAYATFEDRVLASLYFVEEILNWSRDNAERIRQTVEEVDAAPVVGSRLALRAEPERSEEQVQILMGDVEEILDPYSGRTILQRLDVSEPVMMYEYGTFQPTLEETVPAVYYIPPEEALEPVLEKLAFHGVATATLEEETTVQGERFAISSTSLAPREFQGHQERTIDGSWQAAELTLPAGTVSVSMDQPLGRLVFTLLEPASDDGLANWNVLDRALEDDATSYPILRAHR